MLKTFFLLDIVVLLAVCGCDKDSTKEIKTVKPVKPAETFLSAIINQIRFAESSIDAMTEPAEAAAERLIGGGRIFITDDESLQLSGEDEERISESGVAYTIHDQSGAFVAEACDRAGGLGFIKPLPHEMHPGKSDVVLVGTMELHPDDQVKQLVHLKEHGTLIILFGSLESKASKAADYVIDNGLSAGLVPVFIGMNPPTGPIAGTANIVNMWTFTAELVSALTRKGKMPGLWQSMFVPGAQKRNERIEKNMFEQDMVVEPVPPGVLGRQYLDALSSFLIKIRANELPKFEEAGALCADTISNGNNVITWVIGHFMTSQKRLPGFPDVLTILDHENVPGQIDDHLGKDDVLLHIGYSYYPEDILKKARNIGAKTACVMTPGPSISGEGEPETLNMSLFDILIYPYWKHGDAVVEVPGYDTKIIPPSGVVMVTCYWMIIGETMARLAE